MAKHASRACSASHRWEACPGSVDLASRFRGSPSEASAVGTALHSISETCLTEGIDPAELEGVSLSSYNRALKRFPEWDGPFTAEMVEWVRMCVSYVRARAAELGVTPELETQVVITDDCWGTSDVILRQPFGILEVIDFKFGWNAVEAKDNSQLKLYGLGAAGDDIFTDVRLTILQPKVSSEPNTWPQPASCLDEWRAWAHKAIEATRDPNAPLIPGEVQCRWCPAAAACPALQQAAESTALEEFSEVDDSGNVTLSPQIAHDPAVLGELWNFIPLAEARIKAIKTAILDVYRAGGVVPGVKPVRKNARRKLTDPEKASAALGRLGIPKDEREPRTYLSPAQAEKLLKDGDVPDAKIKRWSKKYVYKPEGDVTLANESDKRDAVTFKTADDEFQDKIEESQGEPVVAGFLSG